jgi:hypothetical protein
MTMRSKRMITNNLYCFVRKLGSKPQKEDFVLDDETLLKMSGVRAKQSQEQGFNHSVSIQRINQWSNIMK